MSQLSPSTTSSASDEYELFILKGSFTRPKEAYDNNQIRLIIRFIIK